MRTIDRLQRAADGAGLKRATRDVIFGLIHHHRQTTRTELARMAGLSKGTVSAVVADLVKAGFVREVGKNESTVGRRRVLLEANPRAHFLIGVQLDDHLCTAVLTDLYVQPQRHSESPIKGTRPEDFVDAVHRSVSELRRHARAPVLGVGIGAPGTLDSAGRRVTVWVHGNWHDVAFADLLEERLSLPVRIANRAKVAALGERWHGIAQGVDDLAYVYAGTGIGAGLVIDGSLYSGANGTAGELGHTTVDPDGPLCTCGNRGCLHALASESAIVSRARDKAKTAAGSALLRSVGGEIESITFEAVVRAARAGDQAAREIFHDVGTVLGIGIANLANLFNPRMVVIGGPIAEAEDAVLEPIRQEVARRAYSEARVDLTIARSRLGAQEAGAIGAAALFLEQRGSLPRLSPPRTPLIRRRRAKPGPRRPSERREGAPAHSPRRRNRNPPARRA